MKNVKILYIIILFISFLSFACTKDSDIKETNLSLKEIRNETIGFKMKVPEKVKETQNNTIEASYVCNLGGNSNININIEPALGVSSMQDAIKTASILGGEVKSKRPIGKNFLIINEMENNLSNVVYFAESTKGYIRATITLPSSLENKGIQIATSLTSTR